MRLVCTQPHHFLSVTRWTFGHIQTAGNEDCHVILRGGKQPNYDMFSTEDAAALLEKANLPPMIMVDASHANSRRFPLAKFMLYRILRPRLLVATNIFGLMIESHIVEGRQDRR